IIRTVASFAVNGIVNSARITLFPDAYVNNVFADKGLGFHLHYLHGTVATEGNDIINIGTVEKELVLLKRSTNKSFSKIRVEFLIGNSNFGSINRVEYPDLGLSFPFLAVFLLNIEEIINCVRNKMRQIVFTFFNLIFKCGNGFLELIQVEPRDPFNPDLS